MFIKSNPEEERKIIQELVNSDSELKKQHELFLAEMDFKTQLTNARKDCSLTQQELSSDSGLSQQAISRLERGKGGTIETVLKYLHALGYTLTIVKM